MKNAKKRLATLFGLVAISLGANAQAGQAAPAKGGACWGDIGANVVSMGANTKFSCEGLGMVTIKEIYDKGYRVVSALQSPKFQSIITLIIEEQR